MKKTSNVLKKIDLKTLPLSECNKRLLDYNKRRNLASLRDGIYKSQYCAHDPVGRNDSCQGDSGWQLQMIQPLSDPAKVVGVVSFGIGCGRGLPGIYTRVAHYVEWIGSHVWPNGKIDTPRLNINNIWLNALLLSFLWRSVSGKFWKIPIFWLLLFIIKFTFSPIHIQHLKKTFFTEKFPTISIIPMRGPFKH